MQTLTLGERELAAQALWVFSLSLGERAGVRASGRSPYEYFFVRRVGAVFAGSSGQTCFG